MDPGRQLSHDDCFYHTLTYSTHENEGDPHIKSKQQTKQACHCLCKTPLASLTGNLIVWTAASLQLYYFLELQELIPKIRLLKRTLMKGWRCHWCRRFTVKPQRTTEIWWRFPVLLTQVNNCQAHNYIQYRCVWNHSTSILFLVVLAIISINSDKTVLCSQFAVNTATFASTVW